MILINPPVRHDNWGNGLFGSDRTRGENHYRHEGYDLWSPPGSLLIAPFGGVYERLGRVYREPEKQEYTLMQIRIDPQTIAKIMYIEPLIDIGDALFLFSTPVGKVQKVSKHHPGMKDHLHFEIHVEGVPVDPKQFIDRYQQIMGS